MPVIIKVTSFESNISSLNVAIITTVSPSPKGPVDATPSNVYVIAAVGKVLSFRFTVLFDCSTTIGFPTLSNMEVAFVGFTVNTSFPSALLALVTSKVKSKRVLFVELKLVGFAATVATPPAISTVKSLGSKPPVTFIKLPIPE